MGNSSKTSWTKGFTTKQGKAIWSEDSDSTFIIKPTIAGMYYLRITDAKFPTDLKIRSGMVNVLKEDLFFVVLILSCIVIAIFLFMGDKIGYNLCDSPSKKGFLIALLISLVITFTTVYYSSM
ncbi:MAG: hypothetical protein LUQ20_01000 [Candidatus Methanoperedens sp.]|nr:hypothetical protein [Candidatus Methanoperedens sp.]